MLQKTLFPHFNTTRERKGQKGEKMGEGIEKKVSTRLFHKMQLAVRVPNNAVTAGRFRQATGERKPMLSVLSPRC